MSNILHDLILEGKLDLYLTKSDKEKIVEILKNIKKEFLYKSDFHGLHHSEKVLLFAYLLGKHEGLTEEELEIVIDAALYHDVGRIDETEEQFHGYAGALKLSQIVGNKSIYKNQENMEILKAICDAHSVPDSKMERILLNYEVSEEKKEILFKLARILKDADALDRTRFRKTSVAALKTHFLRFDYSRELVPLSYDVNDYYRTQICEKYFNRYARENIGELVPCLHGIGFNFGALDGILDYGILSEYGKRKKNISACRNFNGNNGDMWISVCYGKGEARKLFVDNGIYFECLVPRLVEGEQILSKAKSEGLPVNSGRYQDERFVFYEIPEENISKLCIDSELLNNDIQTLNYLNCSSNYENLENNINAYLNYFRIKLNFFPNISEIEKFKIELRNVIVEYEGLNQALQKKEQNSFFSKTDMIKSKLNSEIAKMMKEAFKVKLKKDDISVLDVIIYILDSKKIDYRYNDGIFSFKREKKF